MVLLPIYQYRCSKCSGNFEELKKVDDRKSTNCPSCGDKADLASTFQSNPILFKPQFFEHLDTKPVYVESKQQLKRECNQRGLWAKCLD